MQERGRESDECTAVKRMVRGSNERQHLRDREFNGGRTNEQSTYPEWKRPPAGIAGRGKEQ